MENLPTQPLGSSPQTQPAPKAPQARKVTLGFLRNKVFWAIIFIFFILLPAALFLYSRFFTSYVEIPDQEVTNSIYVKRLHLTKAGILNISVSDSYGKPGSTLTGTPGVLPADEYKDFTLKIELEGNTAEELQQEPKPGDKLFAVLYEDSDGNGFFNGPTSFIHLNEAADKPFKDFLGRPIIYEFRVK